MSTSRRLLIANVLMVGALLVHGADHSMQDRGIGALSTEVLAAGFVNFGLGALSLLLAWRRSAYAPLTSLVTGAWVALAVVGGHFSGYASSFTDPYSKLDLGLVSWLAAASEVAAGVWLAAVALMAMRRRPLAAGTL